MDPGLQELLDHIATPDFNENGWGTPTAVTWSGNDVVLDVHIGREWDETETPQAWRLHCRDVRHIRLERGSRPQHDDFGISSSHPVLQPHTDPVAELYFSSRPAHPDALCVKLMEAHRGLFGDWFHERHFINTIAARGSLRDLLSCGFGLLATGPHVLMAEFGRLLSEAGVSASLSPPSTPAWWDGERWRPEDEPLLAVIMGRSYLVCPEITATRR